MQITFNYISDTSKLPTGFVTALNDAAAYVGSIIPANISVKLNVNYAPGIGAIADSYRYVSHLTYDQIKAGLTANATTIDAKTAVANLPATDPTQYGYSIAFAEQKVFGLSPPEDSTLVDGGIEFNSDEQWNFGTDYTSHPTQFDFKDIAVHELTETLGRTADWGGGSVLDLFRYGSPGSLDSTVNDPAYFSIDGGKTNLRDFQSNGDPADWDYHSTSDAFGGVSPGAWMHVSPLDIEEMNVLGYQTSSYSINDITTGDIYAAAPVQYTGPVAGLTSEFIDITADKINVTSQTQNAFIHTGSGDDAVDVSKTNGNNVIDGSTGSNFITNGSGNDTDFVDDRNATADIWSTLNNLHSGANATVWGLTTTDFNLVWTDNDGAAGYKGLTLHAYANNGGPIASVTMVGYNSADLSNGRLSVGFGKTSDVGGLAGSNYMNIHVA